MSLERFCRKALVTASPDETVYEAASRMREHHVGAIVVVAEGKPVGMLTDRDIVLRVWLSERDRGARVRDVMSKNVATAKVGDGIDVAVQRMRDARVRRLPIVGPDGKVCGIVTMDDLVVLFAGELGEAAAAVRSNRGD